VKSVESSEKGKCNQEGGCESKQAKEKGIVFFRRRTEKARVSERTAGKKIQKIKGTDWSPNQRCGGRKEGRCIFHSEPRAGLEKGEVSKEGGKRKDS